MVGLLAQAFNLVTTKSRGEKASGGTAITRGQRHADQGRASEQEVNADQQPERPFGRAGQAGNDEERNRKVEDAGNQQP